MDRRLLQAWWFERQGLMAPRFGSSSADVLARTGWVRSVGGANPYLALFARAGTSRSEIDRELEALEIHELPGARGCTYVVPHCDFALALKVAQGFGDEDAVTTAKKFLGVTEAELERLAEAVLAALAGSPLDPKDLKDAVGDAVRHLGDEGKKRGTITTQSLALGRLQSSGAITGARVTG